MGLGLGFGLGLGLGLGWGWSQSQGQGQGKGQGSGRDLGQLVGREALAEEAHAEDGGEEDLDLVGHLRVSKYSHSKYTRGELVGDPDPDPTRSPARGDGQDGEV